MPAAEVDIDEPLVRALLAEQQPDLGHLPLTALASGWDNVIFRLGDDLVVRLPRRAASAVLVAHEQRWLPELAPRLPLPVPAPVRFGVPGCGFPWSWSVCPWLDGEVAADEPMDDLVAAAATLGDFLVALHQPGPDDAPENPYRGVPLAGRAASTEQRIEQMAETVDGPAVRACWNEALRVPQWSGPPLWLHGDLHPANLLVHGGHLAAVIDFGDLTAGDPATDLSVAWMLFPAEVRPTFRTAAGDPDDATWERARGWALSLGLAYLASSADNPTLERVGRETIAAAIHSTD
jgi:aminoglycoside phosphotransferase (APT) family kinase protein